MGWKSPYTDVHCEFMGLGCAKEDECYLGRDKARQECGIHGYLEFLTYGALEECQGLEQAKEMGCPDLTRAGKCQDQANYCPLMLYFNA